MACGITTLFGMRGHFPPSFSIFYFFRYFAVVLRGVAVVSMHVERRQYITTCMCDSGFKLGYYWSWDGLLSP